MKITIEADLPDEELETIVFEQVTQMGIFGYDLGSVPFQRTIGNPESLYERCSGLLRSLNSFIESRVRESEKSQP